ncbi:MAG: MFS transporter [Opitutaceae bacterium]|nr:MFS transporter [Opitutaceae bacterium]
MTETKPKRENLFLNIIFNVLAPILILTKAANYVDVSPTIILCIAIALPLGYGTYDYIVRKTFNMLSALGLANVLVTGFIGLAELDSKWVAVKEASFPLLIGFAVLASMRTGNPLVRTFLYNPQVLDVDKIEDELEVRSNRPAFDRLLDKATYILVASFLLSAVLNYFLAKVIVTSAGGTEEFNQQIGKMNGLSWIVIVIPTTIISGYALFLLIRGIKQLTGLDLEEVFHSK